MMDLRCDYATVDIVSPLGTSLNVTSHLSKFALDAQGVRQRYQGRNMQQGDVILSDKLVVASIEELHENGEDAVALDPITLALGTCYVCGVYVDVYVYYMTYYISLLLPTTGTAVHSFDYYVDSHSHSFTYFSSQDLNIPLC